MIWVGKRLPVYPPQEQIIAGRIDLLFDHLPNALPQLREGKVRACAVTAYTRSPTAPDIPTVDEAGYPGPEGHTGGRQGQAQCRSR